MRRTILGMVACLAILVAAVAPPTAAQQESAPTVAAPAAHDGERIARDRINPRGPRHFGGTRKVSYGGAQTITCYQAGQVLFQHVGAYFVRSELGSHWMDLKFKINGEWRRLRIPTQSMSCLIEDVGEESVPILVKRR